MERKRKLSPLTDGRRAENQRFVEECFAENKASGLPPEQSDNYIMGKHLKEMLKTGADLDVERTVSNVMIIKVMDKLKS